MKKAFTLVELLGVIIVLGFIALITTPMIMGVVNDYKESVTKKNVAQIKHASETFLASEKMVDPGYIFNIRDFKYEGEQYQDIAINFDELDKASVAVYKDNVCYYVFGFNKDVVVDKEISKDDCLRMFEGPTLARGSGSGGGESTFWGGTLKKNQIEQIDFVLGNAPTDYIGYWDVSQDKNGKILAYYTDIDNNSLYELTVTSNLKIMAPENSSNLFYKFENVHTINFDNFDTTNVTNMYSMFESCSSIISLDISNWDTSKVTSMSRMFLSMEKLVTLDLNNFDTSKVTSMDLMFGNDENLEKIVFGEMFNTSKVTNMYYMFRSVGKNATTFDIGDISNWDVSNVTSMKMMFASAGYNATTFDIGDISNWDVSKVTDMSSMFSSAGYNAQTFDIGDISGWDTVSVTNMGSMFYMTGRNATTWSLGGVNTIDLSGWDLTNVTNVDYMFRYLPSSITTAYARTQADADKLNASSGKPSNINFVVK